MFLMIATLAQLKIRSSYAFDLFRRSAYGYSIARNLHRLFSKNLKSFMASLGSFRALKTLV